MNRAPRFIIQAGSITDGLARIVGPELHHLRDVLRLRAGAEVELIDEQNHEYCGSICTVDQNEAMIAINAATHSAPNCQLILAVGLIKLPRMDFLVEKAAELGATELIPLRCRRSVVHEPNPARLERWQRLAESAAKQSLAPTRLALRTAITVAELVRNSALIIEQPPPTGIQRSLTVVCDPKGAALSAILREHRPQSILLACGPEGGFDDEELAMMDRAGFVAAALGPNRLRTETAAIAALSIAEAALIEFCGRD